MKKALFSLFLVIFVDLLGFGIVIPILPYYAQEFQASGWEIGLLMATYSAMQFLVAPLWGRWSDRVGRKPILLISVLGMSGSMLLLGLANSLTMVFVARFLAGAFGANISTAYAYVADVTDESTRAKGMGLLGAGMGLGFTLGPAIGGMLSRISIQHPMFVAAGLSLINFVLIWKMLEEPKTKRSKAASPFNPFKESWITSPVMVSIVGFFAFTFAVTQLEVVFAIYMAARFGFDGMHTGWSMFFIGFLMVGVQGGLIGRITPKFGEARLAIFALFAGAFALGVFGWTSNLIVLFFTLGLLAISRGIIQPSLSSLASSGAPEDARGKVMGFFHSGSSLGRVLGPVAAGWLYDHVDWSGPFYFGAGLLVLTGIYVVIWHRISVSRSSGGQEQFA